MKGVIILSCRVLWQGHVSYSKSGCSHTLKILWRTAPLSSQALLPLRSKTSFPHQDLNTPQACCELCLVAISPHIWSTLDQLRSVTLPLLNIMRRATYIRWLSLGFRKVKLFLFLATVVIEVASEKRFVLALVSD